MFPDIIETDRLRFEPLTPEFVDTLDLYEHCKEGAPDIDEVTEYVVWDPHKHPKETNDFLQRGKKTWAEKQGVGYVIIPREGEDGAGEIAGTTGISLDWEKDTATLGLCLWKPYWGRGYSGERALALASLAFDRLDVEILSVTHIPENENSERAISKYVERMGGRREGALRNSGADGVDEVRYTVSQQEWRDADLEFELAFYDDADDAPPRPEP